MRGRNTTFVDCRRDLILGVVLGSVLGLLLLAGANYLVYRRRAARIQDAYVSRSACVTLSRHLYSLTPARSRHSPSPVPAAACRLIACQERIRAKEGEEKLQQLRTVRPRRAPRQFRSLSHYDSSTL